MAVRVIDYYSSCASGEIPDNATLKLFSSETFTNFGCFLTLRKLSWLPCGTKFFGVLIFAIFRAIRKNQFPQIKITAKIFPAKIYSRVNILQLEFATQEYSTKQSCLFKSQLVSFIKKHNGIKWNTGFVVWKYVFLMHIFNKN